MNILLKDISNISGWTDENISNYCIRPEFINISITYNLNIVYIQLIIKFFLTHFRLYNKFLSVNHPNYIEKDPYDKDGYIYRIYRKNKLLNIINILGYNSLSLTFVHKDNNFIYFNQDMINLIVNNIDNDILNIINLQSLMVSNDLDLNNQSYIIDPYIIDPYIDECCICLDNHVNVICYPCNHKCLCLNCANMLNNFICPICRCNIIKIINK